MEHELERECSTVPAAALSLMAALDLLPAVQPQPHSGEVPTKLPSPAGLRAVFRFQLFSV